MTTYYGQTDPDWRMWNANYHQIVQVMIQLVKNLSTLRIYAPEWHPSGENNHYKLFNSYKQIEIWIKPKKAYSIREELSSSTENNYNSYEMLSDYNEEENEITGCSEN